MNENSTVISPLLVNIATAWRVEEETIWRKNSIGGCGHALVAVLAGLIFGPVQSRGCSTVAGLNDCYNCPLGSNFPVAIVGDDCLWKDLCKEEDKISGKHF